MITQNKLKQIRLDLPDDIHVLLEKTLNPLAPVRELAGDNISRKINIHLDSRTNDQIKGFAREHSTNKNEIIKAILETYLKSLRERKILESKHISELRSVANQYIQVINESEDFSHRISLTKSTLISTIVTVLVAAEYGNFEKFVSSLKL
jgi:hypothetical protein